MLAKLLRKLLGQQKEEELPMPVKWKDTKDLVNKASLYDDYFTIQKLNVELQWMNSLYNYIYKKERDDYYYFNSKFGNLITGTTSNSDKEKIDLIVYKKIKKKDLEVPTVFDLDNEIHYFFCEKIAEHFENILLKSDKENIVCREKDLFYPKDYIFKVLSFMENIDYKAKRNYDLDRKYFNDLKNKLEQIT